MCTNCSEESLMKMAENVYKVANKLFFVETIIAIAAMV